MNTCSQQHEDVLASNKRAQEESELKQKKKKSQQMARLVTHNVSVEQDAQSEKDFSKKVSC